MAIKLAKLICFILFFYISLTTVSFADNTGYRSPIHAEGAITTSLAEARSLFDAGAIFLDVRNPRFHARAHIPGSIHLDSKKAFNLEAVSAIATKDEVIVIYCSGVKCSRAYRSSLKAVSWGFSKVHYFRGEIVEWRQSGYPEESLMKEDKDQ